MYSGRRRTTEEPAAAEEEEHRMGVVDLVVEKERREKMGLGEVVVMNRILGTRVYLVDDVVVVVV